MGVFAQIVISFTKEANTAYNTNLNETKFEKYDTSKIGAGLAGNISNSILEKDVDTSLSFLALPVLVYSALQTFVRGATSGPSIVKDLLVDASRDLGFPDWVSITLISIITISLLFFILSAVLRSELQ